jgi:protein-disulfide isomerase
MFSFADGSTMGTMTRTSMLTRLGLLAGLAVVIVAIAVVAAGSGGGGSSKGGSTATVRSELQGIPQSGIALGSPKAPVTMVEFADLQCPFCAQYERDVLPTILKRYVRTGKVRLELRLLRFIGPDSDKLARVAAAASGQDRMWQFAALAYQRQGRENSGYATTEFINRLAADAGLKRTSAGPAAEQQVRRSEQAAKTLGIESTPSFLIGPTGGPYTRLVPSDLTPGSFIPAIQEELGG